MPQYEHITVEIANGIASITLNRPPLNVLHGPMMGEINEALEPLVVDERIAAIVFRAAGKAFCAGVDVADHTAEKVEGMIRDFHGIFRRLAATDALTIAVTQGAALGGGCELATFCDIVLASENAKFGQPEVPVGVFPPVAAAVFPYLAGMRRAVELVALGETLTAEEALRAGLVNHVYPADEFDARVSAYLDRIRALSRPVVRMAKQATVGGLRDEILTRLDQAERLYLKELMKVQDAHEGIAAFLEKRPAVWSHV